MKKIISMAMVLVIVLNVFTYSIYGENSLSTASEWAIDEILLAEKADIDEGLFDMNYQANATRAEFTEYALKIYEKLAEVDSKMDNPNRSRVNFSDVPQKQEEIYRAYQYGLIDGVSATEFKPDENLTREQLCTILYRIAEKSSAKVMNEPEFKLQKNYEDSSEISTWALPAVKYMNTYKVIKGNGYKLNPKGNVTRQEAILMGYRLYMQILSNHVAVGVNQAQPITNDERYRNMAIARTYAENQDFLEDIVEKTWAAGMVYANLGDYSKSHDPITGKVYRFIPSEEMMDLVHAMFADDNKIINEFNNTGMIKEVVMVDGFYATAGTMSYYFKEDKNIAANTKITKNIRDKEYHTIGFEVEYTNPTTKQKSINQVYFKEKPDHVSYDIYYYSVEKYVKK